MRIASPMEATRIAPPRRQVRAPGYIGQDGPLSIRLDLSLWGAQDFQSAQSGGVAALDSQFLENVSQVFFHGLFSHATYDGDIAIAFALRNPDQHFRFARSKTQLLKRNW